jgi:D-alanyl-D-alanine carboxypeptidase
MDDQMIQNAHRQKIIFVAEIIGLVLVVLFALFMISESRYIKTDDIKIPVVSAPEQNSQPAAILKLNKQTDPAFKDISISAHSAVVWDVKNQKFIYKKNEKDILPLASLTKLMTAMTATELLPKDSTIRIVQEYLQEENGVGLMAGEKWKSDDLISFTLLTSSNVGSRAIATVAGAFLPQQENALGTNTTDPRELFVRELNNRAAKLGLRSMVFYNDSGLDINENHGGAYGNVEDVAKLSDYILKNHPSLLEPTTHTELNFVSATKFQHDVKNTNQGVRNIPGVIGSKTGYTDLAQGNLVVTFAPALDGPYIAVVMGSTYEGRFTDIEKLVAATLKSVE